MYFFKFEDNVMYCSYLSIIYLIEFLNITPKDTHLINKL